MLMWAPISSGCTWVINSTLNIVISSTHLGRLLEKHKRLWKPFLGLKGVANIVVKLSIAGVDFETGEENRFLISPISIPNKKKLVVEKTQSPWDCLQGVGEQKKNCHPMENISHSAILAVIVHPECNCEEAKLAKFVVTILWEKQALDTKKRRKTCGSQWTRWGRIPWTEGKGSARQRRSQPGRKCWKQGWKGGLAKQRPSPFAWGWKDWFSCGQAIQKQHH